MSKYDYDLIVIGGGSGGISSAILALKLGKKVALVEKAKIGGDCTWYGCVPSKALIKASEIANHYKNLNKYGLALTGNHELNTRQVMAHVRSVREKIYQEEKPEVFEKMGIDVFIGPPKFINNHQIQIKDQTFTAKNFLISTGSSPFIPPIEGIKNVPFLTNETIFELEELPKSMAILGGGPIGTEMASALNRLGVKITQIEMSDSILSKEDKELSVILMNKMKENSVNILTNTRAVKLAKKGNKIVVTAESSVNGTLNINTDSVLVSVGRRPNVDGLDLENAGVEYSSRGIKTNPKLQTTANNIYACGDVIGSYQFSHIAEYHATIAVPNAVLPLPVKRKVDYTNIVWATFTDPEFAHAGLSEAEAREKYGDKIKVYRFSYDKVDRAKTDIAEIGMSKFVCKKNNKILGIHIIGERAADLLHEAQLAKSLGVPFHKIQSMIHIYPTYGDMVKRPATAAYADKLQNNIFIKMIKALRK